MDGWNLNTIVTSCLLGPGLFSGAMLGKRSIILEEGGSGPRFDRLDCCGRVPFGGKMFQEVETAGFVRKDDHFEQWSKNPIFSIHVTQGSWFSPCIPIWPQPLSHGMSLGVTGWVTSYFSSQVRWFGETNRCFSTIPKCQDTKRAIGIYEALNDRKGEAGYLQVLHVSGVGFGGSLHTVFFGSPSIGKRRFFPAWKPRNPVKGKGSERSYSYFYQLLRLMKRQKLLLTSLGSCFFTGKKRHQFLWRNLVVWNEKTCIFFLNIGSKHVLVSLFVLGHWLSIDPPTFFCVPPQKISTDEFFQNSENARD